MKFPEARCSVTNKRGKWKKQSHAFCLIQVFIRFAGTYDVEPFLVTLFTLFIRIRLDTPIFPFLFFTIFLAFDVRLFIISHVVNAHLFSKRYTVSRRYIAQGIVEKHARLHCLCAEEDRSSCLTGFQTNVYAGLHADTQTEKLLGLSLVRHSLVLLRLQYFTLAFELQEMNLVKKSYSDLKIKNDLSGNRLLCLRFILLFFLFASLLRHSSLSGY
ncbi:hypothetical protein BC830DRAFT_1123380 [Chytriomyces sp. MP71]|nr:hypothetical protein BC830DRAFT_1123380 [Chytriomyces sp. MP71]